MLYVWKIDWFDCLKVNIFCKAKPSYTKIKEKEGLGGNIRNTADKIAIIPPIQRNPINWCLEKTKNWMLKNDQRIWIGQKTEEEMQRIKI